MVEMTTNRRRQPDFWMLASFLVLVFLLGGASRDDVPTLVVLRPMSALFLAYAVWRTDLATVQRNKWLIGLAVAVVALPILYLIPLPPAIWSVIPGRTILVEIEEAAGVGLGWRPLSMVSAATFNALMSLLAPLAVLLLGLRLDREDMFRFMVLLVGLALLSGTLGILQLIGGQRGPFYFYEFTNYDSSVGIFANRNHQAVFLATIFPMLAVVRWWGVKSIESSLIRLVVVIVIAFLLVVLLLMTGSRAGLFVGLFGMIATLGLGGRIPRELVAKRKVGKFNPLLLVIPTMLALVTLLAIALGRAEAIDRLLNSDPMEDKRLLVWVPIRRLVIEYMPFGTGPGAFVAPYQIREPDALLSPTYLNHAHNDWLETVMTTGVPGLLILLFAALLFSRAAWRAWSVPADRTTIFARLGTVVIALLALASVADYPLRVPALMSVQALMAAFIANAFHADESRAGRVGAR